MNKRELIAFAIDDTLDINQKTELYFSGNVKVSDFSKADEIIEYCEEKCIRIITIEDDDYPDSLKNVFAPPFVLYVMGELPKIDKSFSISVDNKSFNKKMIKKIIRTAVHDGAIIVSVLNGGFAANCIRNAINLGGKCIVVADRNIDYNKSKYSKEVIKNGAIISEYAPGIKPNINQVRDANRIAIGLSGKVIAENPVNKSNSYLFAAEALANDKNTYLIGKYNEKLTREGAIVIESEKDINI